MKTANEVKTADEGEGCNTGETVVVVSIMYFVKTANEGEGCNAGETMVE
nr:hypothetical protein Itr_chr12CG21680 [Ipomoea trifida]